MNKKDALDLKRAKWRKAYHDKQRLKKLREAGKRKYTKRAKTNGNDNGNGWVLEKGVPVPTFQINSADEHPGHVKVTIDAVIPQPRAMAILHMLEHQAPEE